MVFIEEEMFINLSECGWIMRIFGNDFVFIYVIFLFCVRRYIVILVIVKKNKDFN